MRGTRIAASRKTSDPAQKAICDQISSRKRQSSAAMRVRPSAAITRPADTAATTPETPRWWSLAM
jgi:hypothetical protein